MLASQLPLLHWIGVISQIAGAAILAINVPWSRWAYPLFLIGSVILLILTSLANDEPDVLMWGMYTTLNVLGLYRWFYRGA